MPASTRSRVSSRTRSLSRSSVLVASGGGGGGAFSPGSLSNAGEWLRAKDNGANGSSVSSWLNASDSTAPAIAVGTAPTVVTGATPNGGKAVQFSGTGWYELVNHFNRSTPGLAVGVIRSNEYSAEPAYLAFDGSTGTKWTNNLTGPTGWVGLRLASGLVVTEYKTRGYGGSQDATAWTFQGSNDDTLTSWTTLDTRSGVSSSSSLQTWSFSNSTAYRYYRLNVSATAGNGSALSLVELEITGVTYGFSGSAEAWIVLKSESSANQAIWSFNDGAAGNAHDLYALSGATVYSTFGVGTASAPSFATATYPINTWRLYRVTNDGTNLRVYLDGALLATLAASGMGGVSWPRVMALLGTGRTGRSPAYAWTGKVAEMFTRTAISDAGEIASMHTYFNAEHGLTVT